MGTNDRIRITGICELTTTRPLPRTNWVDGFRLHPRSGEDLAVLRHAPWWTLPRLLWALSIVGIIAVGSMSWGAVLRRRVAEQTEIIRAQIEREAAKDERQRIARELHDTIEQELAGLSVQLRNARQRLSDSPDRAGAALDLAQRMLRHCRQEARTSIRDLRSVALEMRGLDGALEELTGPVATECGAQFRLEVSGKPHHLPGTTAIHLLRIAHEAVANAARHANPRNIEVRLEYAANSVSLEVRDDGCGFDTAAAAPRGHFGLLGIQERAGKLNAALRLASAPGQGTTLQIKAPLAAPALPQN
jgi:signal transduction histidine kinase